MYMYLLRRDFFYIFLYFFIFFFNEFIAFYKFKLKRGKAFSSKLRDRMSK